MVLDSFKFKEPETSAEYANKPQYGLISDEIGSTCGFWLHNEKSWMTDASAEGALKHVKLRMIVVKHNLSSNIYEDLMSDNYRVVPNSFDNRGGVFLMFGSAKAPGEA